MKSFNEFLESVDNEEFLQQADEISRQEIIETTINSENFGKMLELIYQRSAVDAVNLALLYLRRYHEWLSEQLPQ